MPTRINRGRMCGQCRHLDGGNIHATSPERAPIHYCNRRKTWESPSTPRGDAASVYACDLWQAQP